ncbi:HlyD family efflux transporter periplasmic adaptor subunit [Yinghuangia seranimata]|uniref:HlyD family efflux transporter periplasmic adaptor subunit n=1 Tax=Yinghuangia seranimata TaxID=408067 RepID=UPI00248C54DC|nr:HlyD family efflux transporter periplasmic adaptor subunit [Yinghuangia seranimata]MDI2130081.1 HlyD family efflux transporter periplasmic adaptor subunit [Yinghuangia seranimata]
MKFRYQALQRMREPDELDAPVLLAAPRGWIALFVVMIVMTAGVVWTFAGRLDISVGAPGLLTRPAGTARVQSPFAGMVRTLAVRPTDKVTADQPIATIQGQDGQTRVVTSPFAGQVIGVAADAGQVVGPGATLVTVERSDAPNDRMVAMIFVPGDRAARLRPGNAVDLSVSTAPPAAFGLLRGKVTSVSPYPLTPEALAGLVGGEAAAQAFSHGAAPRLVVVDLVANAATASGYEWSTTAGPPMRLNTQVTVSASIDVGSQTPFSLILGR